MTPALNKMKRLCPDESIKENCIDFARLILALVVIFSHSYPLLGQGDSEPLWVGTHAQLTFGQVAVNLFFILSGFLILRSWFNSAGMRDYFQRRILRIYPGFIAAMFFSAVIAALTSPTMWQYWHAFPVKDFGIGLLRLNYNALDVPGCAFGGSQYPRVNGSLWTIPIEFSCYVGIAMYGVFGLYKYRRPAAILFLILCAAYVWKALNHGDNISGDWALPYYFVFGMAAYLFRDFIPRSRLIAAGCLLTAVCGALKSPWLLFIFPFVATYLFFYTVMRPIHRWLAWTKKMDLSYGTYLYGFVIQQALIYWAGIRQTTILSIVASAMTLLMALASWFLIEKRCLKLKRHKFDDSDMASVEINSPVKTPVQSEKPAAKTS